MRLAPKSLLTPRLRDQRHDVLADPAPPTCGYCGTNPWTPARCQLRHHSRTVGLANPNCRLARLDVVLPDLLDYRQALLHPQPVSGGISPVPSIASPLKRPLVEAPGLRRVLE